MTRLFLFMLFCAWCHPSCSGPSVDTPETPLEPQNFSEDIPQIPFSEALEEFRSSARAALADGYRIGAGDVLSLSVWGRPELSGTQTVGPDGVITLPEVGNVHLEDSCRLDALAAIDGELASAYVGLVVTLRVDVYNSLSVVVLGSVSAPGQKVFSEPPSLLSALGAAGGLSVDANGVLPQQCSVLRGERAVLWVDLDALLRQGDLSLNVDLAPGDVVHVAPDSRRVVYVLGAVARPGVYPLRDGLTAAQVLALAGGVEVEGQEKDIRILHPRTGAHAEFDFVAYSAGDFGQDARLGAGDVLFVPRSGLADAGWVIGQFAPLAQMLFFYDALSD